MTKRLVIVGNGCRHNTLYYPTKVWSETEAIQRANEILREFDTDGGQRCNCLDGIVGPNKRCNGQGHPGSPTGPPNPCGPHRIIEE